MPEAALFSLSDKTGAAEVAKALADRGVVIYATGGTRAFLAEKGIDARDVEELTGFPPLFDGRVKTLHPKVFGAILYDRRNPTHQDQARTYAIHDLRTLVVNLYPFEATVAKRGTTLREAIEQIDIGGVSLLRAAAKNFSNVTILSHPSQYPAFLKALGKNGGLDENARRRLAITAFERTAEYDAAIAHYLATEGEVLPSELPGALALTMPLAQPLRYGENPQLRAAFYLSNRDRLPEQLHGKDLSYNNLLDLDATLRLLSRAPLGAEIGSERERFVRAGIVKHTVPCGVAQRSSAEKAVRDALDADPVSAFGGIIAVDANIDLPTAQALSSFFLEIVAAPSFDADALALLKKKKNLRIMRYAPSLPDALQREVQLRSALGGVLAEEEDRTYKPEAWRVVSKRQPSAQEWHDLAFAWDVVRHVKSNGIAIVKGGATRGICAGQTNRVSAVQIAAQRAGEAAKGAACASDGFFPFADGLEAAAAAGCTAVIAPHGSLRDADVIEAADRLGVALVFSTHRYFLH
ncbi:MAG TPA: bifunctional phosphoribosylaminoimidazolecarboxamide formyltransferase/IMP cyclohydrolase [Candidatus Baltobacteraceae bacterium]|nr:bifunctional phosphoribosylaminoimidazolecarboxamide formyltransferase/IMP cyclohydrolase [Candidatus Baltobacteraceae bacterium]